MLEYTLDGSASAPSATSSTALSWDHFQWRLEEFLKEGQPSSSSFDQMCDWINVSICRQGLCKCWCVKECGNLKLCKECGNFMIVCKECGEFYNCVIKNVVI
jgi:hypothetical protein